MSIVAKVIIIVCVFSLMMITRLSIPVPPAFTVDHFNNNSIFGQKCSPETDTPRTYETDQIGSPFRVYTVAYIDENPPAAEFCNGEARLSPTGFALNILLATGIYKLLGLKQRSIHGV